LQLNSSQVRQRLERQINPKKKGGREEEERKREKERSTDPAIVAWPTEKRRTLEYLSAWATSVEELKAESTVNCMLLCPLHTYSFLTRRKERREERRGKGSSPLSPPFSFILARLLLTYTSPKRTLDKVTLPPDVDTIPISIYIYIMLDY
jgi:hypothetical protein